MSPIGIEILDRSGETVAQTTVPEEPGSHQIADSSITLNRIIPGRRNGQVAIKAIDAQVSPPFSDDRQQRFSFNGPSSEIVPPVADNTLGGGTHRARFTLTTNPDSDSNRNGSF